MNKLHESIDEFWRWFAAREADFEALDSGDPFWDEAIVHLKQLDEHLWFEMSRPDGDDREFIITAEGHAEAFPVADEIVARAPEMHGWQFIALKPPRGFDFEITYENIRFDPREMWFHPMESDSHPELLGLQVGVPDFKPAIERQAGNAVAVILDTALGERAAAQDIQHIEVCALPKNPDDEGYIMLTQLPEYIEWRKNRNSQPD